MNDAVGILQTRLDDSNVKVKNSEKKIKNGRVEAEKVR